MPANAGRNRENPETEIYFDCAVARRQTRAGGTRKPQRGRFGSTLHVVRRGGRGGEI